MGGARLGGMSIIVLVERDTDRETGPSGVEPAVVAVHASGSGPDVPLDPLTVTLCGLHAVKMEHLEYQRTRPGRRWYPPEFAAVRCSECERVLRARRETEPLRSAACGVSGPDRREWQGRQQVCQVSWQGQRAMLSGVVLRVRSL
ncbi:hypothetical protein CG736_11435 [Kitasatospora sp. CB02891]|nr:hypothetical protein CG736_11435 [Kitasatospora sp. CB02891]